MRLKNLSVWAAITQLALLAGTGALLAGTGTVPALASGVIDPTSTPDNSMTPSGVVIPDNSQQLPNVQEQPRPPWSVPYWSNGNICRDQGVDMVCLTPQEANKLRWPIPSKYRSSYQNNKIVR